MGDAGIIPYLRPFDQPRLCELFWQRQAKKEERKAAALRFSFFCGILIPALSMNGKRLVPCFVGGRFLPPDPTERGAASMSTSEVLQLCLVIIGICSLFLQAGKKK